MTHQIKSLASAETATRHSATKALLETVMREGETLSPAAAALAVLEPVVAAPGAHRAAWVLGEVFAAGVDPPTLASAARGERDSHARTSLALALGFGARAEEDARRALIAAAKPFSEVLEAATDGLTARAKLDALTELLRGAYRILWDARGRISPEALAEEAARAGDEAVAWAKDIVHEVVALPQGIRDFRALSGFASGHLMVALAILVRAGVPLEAGVERQVSLPDPAAREILAALPADAVRRATLERWHTQASSNPAGRHLFVDEVMPLFDVVGSPELAREMLANLGGAGAKPPPGIAPAIMDTLARIVGDG